jgi:hypothetical protein
MVVQGAIDDLVEDSAIEPVRDQYRQAAFG